MYGAGVDLSIVVLSWNTADLTLRALAAAAEGSRDLDAQLICVDNASADDTVARVRAELPGVRLIVNEANLGFAAGNNRALPHLEGRITCFLNSDCVPRPGSLTHAAAWLEDHPEVGVVAPRLENPDGRLQKAARQEARPLGLLHRYTALRYAPLGRRASRAWRDVPEEPVPQAVDSVTGACLMIRTDLLRRLGGFDEGYPFYWEDVDLCRRAREAGAGVAWVPDGPAVVHEGGSSVAVAGGPPRLSFAQGLLRYQAKHLGPWSSAVYRGVFVVGLVVRTLVEPLRLCVAALASPGPAARRRLASAGTWLRHFERDGQGMLRLLRRPS
jgi:GT2 family glycosyltransferase